MRAITLLPVVLLLTGCVDTARQDLIRENGQLRARIDQQDNQLVAQKADLDQLSRQLAAVRAIQPGDLAHIFHPEQIQLARLTGGTDSDGQAGDDGVTVYVQPLDSAGDVLKAAGALTVELYDLAAPAGQQLVGQLNVPVEEISQYWYGKFMTNHYTLTCPWSGAPPRHPEITVRVTFIDYLTQRPMTAQTTCTVALPPGQS